MAIAAVAGYVGSYTGLGGGMIIKPLTGTMFAAQGLTQVFGNYTSKVVSLSSNMGVFVNGAVSTPNYVKNPDIYEPN